MNAQKQVAIMEWQDSKITIHNLTEKQKKAFCELYQTKTLFDEIFRDNQEDGKQ